MSNETMQHLNLHTLIGNTDARGHAWHYRAEDQGAESNHYPGPIPVEDVERRLFSWNAVSCPLAVEIPADVTSMTHLSTENEPMSWKTVGGRQAIVRDDTHAVMGIFTTGYEMHSYRKWLLTTVADILDDTLSISSAGLLRGGPVAWVEVPVPESITTPEGVEFRPNLLATTSFDGSIATTFKRTVTDVVCDNTRRVALSEDGQEFKVKHSRNSRAQLAPAREALAMVHTISEDFSAEVTRLCQQTVTPMQWEKFVNISVPMTDKKGEKLTGRALTTASNKRDALQRLYRHDDRVAPWSGTAHGVVQAVNTYVHHEGIVRGATRAERNMLKTVTGAYEELDATTLRQLDRVLG